jgi:uncharacterized protein (TIGR02996 family)
VISAAEQSLLQAIVNDPDAESPRTALADWCRQMGGDEGHRRAKFIRIQLTLHKVDALHPRMSALKNQADQLLRECGHPWKINLHNAGWVVKGWGRGLPSEVVSRKDREVRPTPLLAGVDRMALQPHSGLTATVTELSHSEWSNGVRRLELPDATDPLAVVTLALTKNFLNLTELVLPPNLLDQFTAALAETRAASIANHRLPPLLKLRTVNGSTAPALL